VAAGLAQLKALRDTPQIYANLEELGARLESAFRGLTVNRAGSMLTPFFTRGPVTDWESASRCDTKRFARFHRAMRERGVLLPPSQFEAMFVSFAHTKGDVERTVRGVEVCLSR